MHIEIMIVSNLRSFIFSTDIDPRKQWATVLTVLGFFFDVIEVGYYVIGASHAMHSNDTFPMSTWTAQLNPLLVRGGFCKRSHL